MRGTLAPVAVALATLAAGCGDAERHELSGRSMGTTYSVRIDALLTPDERDELAREVRSQLERIDDLMSTWDSTSEVSRFNRTRTTAAQAVDFAVLDVVSVADRVSASSDGAFDVTVAPLADAWGFGTVARSRIPADSEVAALLDRVGFRLLSVDPLNGTLAKENPLVAIDLSGIAKGYAVDRVTDALLRRGLSSFLVDVGGELRVVGARADGLPWRVAVERPDAARSSLYGTIELTDAAVATSGDYRDFFEERGVRYAHIVDPRTGRPVVVRDLSVSVVHDDAATADAWATALVVLGPDVGFGIARREEIAAVFIEAVGDEVHVRETPAFRARGLSLEPTGGR